MVEDIGEYRWCSHHVYLGKQKLKWLTAEFVLAMFASDEKAALARYLAFVADATDDELRSEFYSGACDGRILGNDDFADKAIQKAHQEPYEHYTLSDVLATVSSILKIAETEIVAPVKAHEGSEARAVAALIVEEASHLSLTGLAALCRRDASGLGKIAQRLRKRVVENAELAAKVEEVRSALRESPNV